MLCVDVVVGRRDVRRGGDDLTGREAHQATVRQRGHLGLVAGEFLERLAGARVGV